MRLRAFARHAVRLARIGHHLERQLGLLQSGVECGRVLEHHIVVRHAVQHQQRIADLRRERQRVGRGIGFRIGRRIAQIAFGIMGVVQLPARDRRARNARREHARRLLQQLQRHVAAIGPAIDRDLLRIDEILRLQPGDAGQLVLHLHRAHRLVDLVLERRAAVGRPAPVDRKHDPAAIDQILLDRRAPAARHLPPAARPAIHLHEHRIFPPGHARGRQQLVLQRAAVLGLQRPEHRHRMARQIGGIRMRRIQPVLLDPRGPRAAGIGQIHLRRLLRVRSEHQRMRRRTVHRRGVEPARLGQLHGRLRFRQIDHIQLLLDRAVAIGQEIHLAAGLVDADHVLHRPVAPGQRAPFAARIAIEMRKAAAFGHPDETAVGQRMQPVVQVDPRLGGLAEQQLRLARIRVHFQQVQPVLVAALALHIQRSAILRPVDPRQIDIGIAAQIHLHPAGAVGRHHIQLHLRIGRARRRIALLEQPGALRADRRARHHLHPRLVHPRHRDPRIVRRPPVAGAAVHLLLRHELGRSPRHGAAAAAGQPPFHARSGIDHIQILIAHEAHIAAAGRHLGIHLRRRGLRQAADGAVQRRQIQVAVDRHQDRLAVRCPVIAHDPARAAQPRALAPHLLRLRYFGPAAHLPAVHQHARLPGGGVHRPQVIPVAVVRAVAQQRRQPPVGRQFRAARHRPAQRRAGKHPVQRQRLWRHRRLRRCDGRQQGGGKQGDAKRHGLLRQGSGPAC